MKSQIIGNKENNLIKKYKPKYDSDKMVDEIYDSVKFSKCYSKPPSYDHAQPMRSIHGVSAKKSSFPSPNLDFLKSIGNSDYFLFHQKNKLKELFVKDSCRRL